MESPNESISSLITIKYFLLVFNLKQIEFANFLCISKPNYLGVKILI